MAKAPIIGIDLGTTESCVGVWQNGKVEIVENYLRNKTTPNYVAFTDIGRLVGNAAENQVQISPQNTVFCAKRLLGMKCNDEKIQADIRDWPFKVVESVSGRATIKVDFKDEDKIFAPEEICSIYLRKMKETVEAHLMKPVKNAVVSVPACFNNCQRQAILDAGVIAGLNVMRLINEPTAAALAYGSDKNFKSERCLLIFDLGAGTCDVSIVNISKGSLFAVKATAGDSHLGGEDFDSRLVSYLADEFADKFKKDLRDSPRSLKILKDAAESAKRTLSLKMEATIEIKALYQKIDFRTKISRGLFEEMCSDLFQATVRLVEKVLTDAKLHKNSIDEIILVGGSTKIPKIQQLIQNYFNEKSLNLSLNPHEAVAYGATLLAAVLSGEEDSKIRNVRLVDVTPHSLGVSGTRGLISKFIERNTRIPCKHSKIFSTDKDSQSVITIEIREGERPVAKDNNCLGKFDFSGIPPASRGQSKVEVVFELDINGILHVSLKDKNKSRKISIVKHLINLSQAEIDRMVASAEESKGDYETQWHKEAYAYQLKQVVDRAVESKPDEKAKAEKDYHDYLEGMHSRLLAEQFDRPLPVWKPPAKNELH